MGAAEPRLVERGQQNDAALLLRLQTLGLAQPGFERAATAFATALCDRLRCDRVTVGWRDAGSIKIVAVSHSADFDPRQAIFQKIASAMDEAAEQASTVVLPAARDRTAQVAMAHHELLAAGTLRALCTVLLADQAQIVGALTLERAVPLLRPEEILLCEDAAALMAPLLGLKRRAELSWPAATGEALRRAWRRVLSPEKARGKLILAAALAGAVALCWMPLPYSVSANARLEGFVQRVVAAPVDGYLEQVNVRPGDRVKEGQVLAQLSVQDLQTERLKRQSELAQHENLYKAALARNERTQLVVNQAKAQEAQAQLALIENRLQRSQLRSPFDGVVIKGDLSQNLGAPVQRGEVLLTLAPDDRFRLIVELDERDVALVQPGMRGSLALAASPAEPLGFKVLRIGAVAVSAEGRNFFEVEGALDAPAKLLRPGLRGVAKIEAGTRSAAWIATHRLVDWLRLTLWKIGA